MICDESKKKFCCFCEFLNQAVNDWEKNFGRCKLRGVTVNGLNSCKSVIPVIEN